MAKKSEEMIPQVMTEKDLRNGSAQENVLLITGQTLTRAKARELFKTSKSKLSSHADLICVQKAMEQAGVDLAWEIGQLKKIVEQDKDYKAALQALGMIQLIREAALQGAGSGGSRMTAKEAEAFNNIHIGEMINVIGDVRSTLGVKGQEQFDRKVVDAEIKAVVKEG